MAEFELRSVQQIVADMVAYVSANSEITDFNEGSATLTLLEAASSENANTYIQMLSIIRAYSIDNLTGADLDERAYEVGLIREEAAYASDSVTIGDSAFEKVETPIYSGLPGPSAGSTTVYGVANSGFSGAGGSLIIGRNTNNLEVVDYLSITDFSSYYRFNLDPLTPLTKDHGVDETIILSQGGDRTISAGTSVYAPATDVSDRISYTTLSDAIIEDGDVEVEDVVVVAVNAGADGNVGVGRINSFTTLPFSTATVTNPQRFSNGRDEESDDELRDRIKGYIQSLSRGVVAALLASAQQVESEEQQNKVLSTSFREATTLNDLNFLYVDDGSGLEPIVKVIDFETVLNEAAGTERFLQLNPDATPLLKAALVSRAEGPYSIAAGLTLIVAVNDEEETLTFGGTTDFADPSAATAAEVVVAMNNRLSLIEARTTEDKTRIILQAKAIENERIRVVGGTANEVLNFKTGVDVETLRLYVNDVLLSKDGFVAFVDSENSEPFSIPNPSTLTIVVDGKSANEQTVTFTTETTAENIVDTINDQLSGAVASAVNGGTQIRITSNNPDKGASSIEITGGTANSTGSNPLNFPTDEVVGEAADFTLNRFNGQIELAETLEENDEVTAGSPYTRAYLETSGVGPYSITSGELLVYQVDDIVDTTVTTGTSTTSFAASSLIGDYIDNHFTDYYVRFKDATTTVALRGVYRAISAFVSSSGTFTTAAFPAIPAIGDTFEVVQIVTMPSTASLTPDEAVDLLNPYFRGATMYAREKGTGDTYLRFQTNSYDEDGTIRIHGATTAVGFGFTAGVTATAQTSNIGYVESTNEMDFTFGRGQTLIVILDDDPASKTVSVEMDVDGEVTTSTSTTSFKAIDLVTLYPDDDFFIGFRCRFTDATTTTAIRSEIREVTAYNATDGTFTVGSAFSGTPAVGDTFELIPTTAKNVEDLFRANGFSTLAVLADILASNNGRSIQIASTEIGSEGSVQIAGGTANNFEILLTSDGTAGGQCNVASIDGLSIGLELVIEDDSSSAIDVTITNITASGDEWILSMDVDAGGTDISAYTVVQNAVLTPRNQFAFSTLPVEGVDGYKYHGGLIQQVQWTIDSKDTDYTTYPGIKAAGVQIEVTAPIMTFIEVIVNVTTKSNISLSTVSNAVKAAISEYINSLGVGEDVIVAEIIASVMNVTGIIDVEVNTPDDNIIIQDHELARISDADIQVG